MTIGAHKQETDDPMFYSRSRKTVQTSFGAFEQEGDGWVYYHEYDHGDIELSADDANGEPDPNQVALLTTLVPQLSAHEAVCRRKLGCVEEHDLSGVFFKDGCDFVLAFNWGNGEWGRTVFVKMTSGKVGDSYIVSD